MHVLKVILTRSFQFAEKIVDQQLDFFMGSLDVESQFTNIPLEETIEICTTVEGLSKSEFKVSEYP